MTDADEKAPFDPHARFIARDGIAYKDFAAYLVGQPDPKDLGNINVARYRAEGRSEAFCRCWRKGYDGWVGHARTRHEAHRQAAILAHGAATRTHGYQHAA